MDNWCSESTIRIVPDFDRISMDVFFCATGITDGELLAGVRYERSGVRTHSIVMRSKSGTIRMVDSLHQLSKLRAYAAVDFDRN